MPSPTFAQLRTLGQSGTGYNPESIDERILTAMAILASGQNPDGSASTTGSLATAMSPNSVTTTLLPSATANTPGTPVTFTPPVGFSYLFVMHLGVSNNSVSTALTGGATTTTSSGLASGLATILVPTTAGANSNGGQITVVTTGGVSPAVYNYTGITANTSFNGCTLVAGSGTVNSGAAVNTNADSVQFICTGISAGGTATNNNTYTSSAGDMDNQHFIGPAHGINGNASGLSAVGLNFRLTQYSFTSQSVLTTSPATATIRLFGYAYN